MWAAGAATCLRGPTWPDDGLEGARGVLLRWQPGELALAGLGGGYPSAEPSAEERAALDAIATFRTSGNGYLIEQNTVRDRDPGGVQVAALTTARTCD
jgi:hypothetical protein